MLKHLEAAPKEILGDFPRLTREAAVTLVFQTEAKNKGWLEDEGKTVEEIQKSCQIMSLNDHYQCEALNLVENCED